MITLYDNSHLADNSHPTSALADAKAFKKIMKHNDIRRLLYACDNVLLGKMLKVNKDFQRLAIEDFVYLYHTGQLTLKAKMGLANTWMQKVGIDSTKKYLENYLVITECSELTEMTLPFRLAFSIQPQGNTKETELLNEEIALINFKGLTTLRILSPTLADISSLINLKSFDFTPLTDARSKQIVTDFSFLKNLTNLDTLTLNYSSDFNELEFLSELHKLKHLTLFIKYPFDLKFLRKLSKLETLILEGCEHINNFEYLKHFRSIKILNLKKFRQLNKLPVNLSFLTSLRKLEQLALTISNKTDVSSLNFLPKLKNLDIDNIHKQSVKKRDDKLHFLKFQTHLTFLRLLDMNAKNLNCLESLNTLKTLILDQCCTLESFDGFTCRGLASLTLINCVALTNLNFLKDLKKLENLELVVFESENFIDLKYAVQLKSLTITWCNSLTNLDFLKELSTLQNLALNSYTLNNFEGLKYSKSLKQLEIFNCRLSSNFQYLQELNNLETLSLGFLDKFEGLERLIQLKELKITRCSLDNLNFLSSLQKLNTLDLTGCKIQIPYIEFLKSLPIKTIILPSGQNIEKLDHIKTVSAIQ